MQHRRKMYRHPPSPLSNNKNSYGPQRFVTMAINMMALSKKTVVRYGWNRYDGAHGTDATGIDATITVHSASLREGTQE